jgi:hypothetical protein
MYRARLGEVGEGSIGKSRRVKLTVEAGVSCSPETLPLHTDCARLLPRASMLGQSAGADALFLVLPGFQWVAGDGTLVFQRLFSHLSGCDTNS